MRIPVYVIDFEDEWGNPMSDYAKASLSPAPIIRFGENETVMFVELPECYKVEKWFEHSEPALYHLCDDSTFGGSKPELVVDEDGHSRGEVHFWWFHGNRRECLTLTLFPFVSLSA